MKNNDNYYFYLIKIKQELGILIFSIGAFLTPILGMVLLVGVAVFCDTCAGVYIARKNKTYESDKLFNIVVKTFFYMTTILMAFLIDLHIFEKKIFDISYLGSKVLTMFWIYIEAKSLDEKSQKLGNKPFVEVITNLIKWVKAAKKDINEIKE